MQSPAKSKPVPKKSRLIELVILRTGRKEIIRIRMGKSTEDRAENNVALLKLLGVIRGGIMGKESR